MSSLPPIDELALSDFSRASILDFFGGLAPDRLSNMIASSFFYMMNNNTLSPVAISEAEQHFYEQGLIEWEFISEQYSAETISSGNNIIIKVVEQTSTQNQFVIQLSSQLKARKLSEAKYNQLADAGIVANKLFSYVMDDPKDPTHELELNIQPFNPKGSLDQIYKAAFKGKKYHSLEPAVQIQEQCADHMLEMIDKFQQLQERHVLFTDAKLPNWMQDAPNSDVKGYVELDESDRYTAETMAPMMTKGYKPPEMLGGMIKGKQYDIDKVHAYILGRNLFTYLTSEHPPVDPRYKVDCDLELMDEDLRPPYFTKTEVGKQYWDLILELTVPNPANRKGLDYAKQKLNEIKAAIVQQTRASEVKDTGVTETVAGVIKKRAFRAEIQTEDKADAKVVVKAGTNLINCEAEQPSLAALDKKNVSRLDVFDERRKAKLKSATKQDSVTSEAEDVSPLQAISRPPGTS